MIGALTYRVTLQEAVRTPDGGGGFTEAWQNIAETPTVYAAIQPLSGGEAFRFRQLEAAATHRIIIRHRTDITSAHRLLHGTDIYDIVSVLDADEKREFLEIVAVYRPL